MKKQAMTPRKTREPISRDERFARSQAKFFMFVLERHLSGLGTAHTNRILLKLHSQIGEQLDALAANNNP